MAPGNFRGHFFAIYARNSIASWWTNFVRTHCAAPDGADPQRSSRFPTAPAVGCVLPSLRDSPKHNCSIAPEAPARKTHVCGVCTHELRITSHESRGTFRPPRRPQGKRITSHYSPVTSPYDADDRAYRDRSCG